MYTYLREELEEIQETIINLIGEWVSIEDAVETYHEIIDNDSPLY